MSEVQQRNQYVQHGDHVYCTRHDVLFAMTGQCAKCNVDPGPTIDLTVDAPLGPPPAGCVSTLDIERHIACEADRVLAAVHEFAQPADKAALVPGKGDDSNRQRRARPKPAKKFLAVAFKGWETWLKLKRAQTELARQREDAELVRAREAVEATRRRSRGGGGAGN